MVSVPQSSSHPTADRDSNANTDATPILALKQLVARLHKEQHKIHDLLGSLGFALRSFSNLNQFLELIPLMATRVTDADGGALVLFKPNGQVRLERLHCQDSRQSKTIRKALEMAISVVTASLATATGIVPATATAALDTQVSQYLGSGTQLFGTTVFVKQVERGRLYVFSSNPEYSWTESREKLVRLIADLTAVAIENDELTAELRKKERLNRELEIGAEIQLRLLPSQCPNIAGITLAARCQPASHIGGDYYDFIPTNCHPNQVALGGENHPCRWGIVIGDVMGKGVPAGLLMTMTQGMLRTEVPNGNSPAQILQKLNRVIYADLENSHRFITLFCSAYDPLTRTLYYSNAAHNPPLLWQAATGNIKRLDTWGMLIGLDAESQYEDAHIQLHPGDTIIYYTDGFTDAANQNGDRFDEENLIRKFYWACQHCQGPQAILEYLFEQVYRFVGSANQNKDDMTLIVLQVKNE